MPNNKSRAIRIVATLLAVPIVVAGCTSGQEHDHGATAGLDPEHLGVLVDAVHELSPKYHG